ncbi:MAG: GH3 auxin-responsive promoter family protein [Bacteroidota bacterium]
MPINSVFAWFIKKRLHQIELFKQYPHDVQNEIRDGLIDFASLTTFGKEHQFKKIKSYSDFSSAIPVRKYEDLWHYIEKTLHGETNILWPGQTQNFAKSSGTTNNRSKYIPITEENLENCHYKGGKDLLALYYSLRPMADLYSGKTLIVGGSQKLNSNEHNVVGDLSGIIISNLPIWVEMKRVPSKEISLMENWEDKILAMAKGTMNEDVRVLSGVPSWTQQLLKKILELSGKENINQVWPNLQLYMHGGVSFLPYEPAFDSLLPNKTTDFFETYNASEGFFGIQDQLNSNELLLMLDYGVFYEFIPEEEWHKESPKALPLEDVQINTPYALVITTNSGLWRYNLGDTIAFTSTTPYRFKIIGRTKAFINLVGEELMVHNVEQAISVCSKKMHVGIIDFTVAPIPPNNQDLARHEWFIEFSDQSIDLNRFANLLDEELRQLNSDYDAKRHGNLNLLQPIVNQIQPNGFNAVLKNRNKLGGQHKIPRLINSREWANDLKNYIS